MSSDSQPIVSEFFKSEKELREEEPKHKMTSDDDDEVNVDSESLDKDTTASGDQAAEEGKDNTLEANDFPYLDYLFSFLDNEEINLTSAGYFAKIVNNLLNKRPSEVGCCNNNKLSFL